MIRVKGRAAPHPLLSTCLRITHPGTWVGRSTLSLSLSLTVGRGAHCGRVHFAGAHCDGRRVAQRDLVGWKSCLRVRRASAAGGWGHTRSCGNTEPGSTRWRAAHPGAAAGRGRRTAQRKLARQQPAAADGGRSYYYPLSPPRPPTSLPTDACGWASLLLPSLSASPTNLSLN